MEGLTSKYKVFRDHYAIIGELRDEYAKSQIKNSVYFKKIHKMAYVLCKRISSSDITSFP